MGAKNPGTIKRQKEKTMNYLTKLYVMLVTFMGSLKDRKGQTLVEYALLLALIAIVCITVVTLLGNKATNVYSNVAASLQ